MLFTSDRPGGHGNGDLYVSELTDKGWSTPVNLGPVINTSQTDVSPFLAGDGKTLYFSSDGHFGFGDRDMFVSKRQDDSWTNWSKPVNMGKYINTLSADAYFSIPESGSRGYIVGSGGIETNGSDDIFEFILPPSLRPEALFHVYGNVTDENDSAAAVIIKYIDMEDGKEVAKTISNETDGSYAVSLPSFRKYQVIVDMNGFLYYSAILDLTDPSQYFKKKTFAEILGEDYDLLKESNIRMERYGVAYDTLLEAGIDTDMTGNFENMIKLALQYDKEATEMDRILRNARYEYLSELENQREVIQDHDVTRIKVGAKVEIKNIFFDFGKASLRADSREELDKLYDIMNRSEIVIEFGGHTDNVGSDETNLRLSQERVNSVKTYLVDKGINEARIAAVGYGETQPIADNETEEGRQRNRRVELQITQLRLEREGADELTGDEEFDGLKEESLLVAGSSVQADLLEKFRKAAELGGLPSGSDCGKEITTTTPTTTNDDVIVGSQKQKKTRSSNWGSRSIDDLDYYIYKRFNPYVASYGTDAYGGSFGAGFALVKESNLRELHLKYNFINPEGITWSGTGEVLWTIKALSPFHLHYGVEMTLMGRDSLDELAYINIPVGARYIFDVAGIKLGPEFIYSFQALASDGLSGESGQSASSKYIRLGVNARWKFIQGGLFINKGDFVDYTGIRAGFAF